MKNGKKTELLAPAGSLEAFFAAMEKGADGVYVGLKEFSARAKAKNFTLPEMQRMVRYAHSLQRRVYVTLNTLVKERELPALADTLAALEEMRCDAVIIQDLAVWKLAREHFPGLEIHASTQMTVHNAEGVRQLEEMGFHRVVLARELHIDQIRAISRTTKLELECFIHGALCFSFSGQCYFSSFLGGHSGNRGRCAQPCRRLYRSRGKEGYYLSTNDFSSIDLVHDLVEAGVVSLKIEGRMKAAEYVATVVEAYRKVLDAPAERRGQAVAEGREILKRSFGRMPTAGFLASRTPADIASPHRKGATGRFLGEIKSVSGGYLRFETRDRLHIGDRVRIQPKSDMSGRAFTVREIILGKKSVTAADAGSRIALATPFPCTAGDAVFKVSSETAFTLSEAACRKRLEGVREKFPVSLALSLEGGDLQVTADAAGTGFSASFSLGEMERARSTGMEEVLRGQFMRTGDTPFQLESLAAPGFPAVAIPPARLKEVRREFYRLLEERVREERGERLERKRRAAREALQLRKGTSPQGEELAVRVEQLRDAAAFPREQAATVIVPLNRSNLSSLAAARRSRERIVWHLPFIIFDEEMPFYREGIAYLREQGFSRFELSNISHFQLVRGEGVEISTDYRLFSLNSQALLAWSGLGVDTAGLYIEDDLENLAELLSAELPIRRQVLLYGPIPLITSRIPIRGVREDAPLVSDRGDRYRVTERRGLTTVTAEPFLCITGWKEALRRAGCSSFALDLSATPPEKRKEALDAFLRGENLPNTTTFNLKSGLL